MASAFANYRIPLLAQTALAGKVVRVVREQNAAGVKQPAAPSEQLYAASKQLYADGEQVYADEEQLYAGEEYRSQRGISALRPQQTFSV